MRADQAIFKLIKDYDFETVLDVGFGKGEHAEFFRKFGKDVTTVDFNSSADFVGDYLSIALPTVYDCVWASHVLEHQLEPQKFIKKCLEDLKEGGILVITVPPRKDEIVGGHVTLWNSGLLVYHLLLAGCDCSDVSIKQYDYNISVMLEYKPVPVPNDLQFAKGDLEKFMYAPPWFYQGCNGHIDKWNW